MKLKIHTAEFVLITDLVPLEWRPWFFEKLSEAGGVTWGDMNRSLVTAEHLADTCEFFLGHKLSHKKFLKRLRELGEMLVDLEN